MRVSGVFMIKKVEAFHLESLEEKGANTRQGGDLKNVS